MSGSTPVRSGTSPSSPPASVPANSGLFQGLHVNTPVSPSISDPNFIAWDDNGEDSGFFPIPKIGGLFLDTSSGSE